MAPEKVQLYFWVLGRVSESPNPRLAAFGQSLGRFQGQVASFVSFASEAVPFPFADWPSAEV
jgi:hypothetical protein